MQVKQCSYLLDFSSVDVKSDANASKPSILELEDLYNITCFPFKYFTGYRGRCKCYEIYSQAR
jgi:hypothetical protein